MAPQPFAAPSELIDLLDDPTLTESRALQALIMASGAIRAAVRWSLTREVVVNQRIRSTGRSLWLPTLRLTAVDALALDSAPAALVEGAQFDWSPEGKIDMHYSWAGRPTTYRVSYRHGYPDDHPAVQLAAGVALSAAARLVDNPTGHRSETITGQSFTAAGGGADVVTILAEAERKQLEAYALPELG